MSQSFSVSAAGLLLALMVLPPNASSYHGAKMPLLLASNTTADFEHIEGKPSTEEIRAMNFKDSVRLDSVEKARVAERDRNRRAVAIKAGEADCLASLTGDGTCLVTVGTLNRRIASSTGGAGFSDRFGNNRDSVVPLRRAHLKAELSDAFASLLFDRKIANPYIEEVEAEWKKELIRNEENIGKRKLHAIHRDYSSILNRVHTRYASVIGSSDSVVLDSLINRSFDSISVASRRNRMSSPPDGSKPVWSRVEFGLLPAELSETLDTLPSDDPSPIQKTKIGWFSCSIRRPAHASASYEQALPLLIEIALRGGSVKNILLQYGPQKHAPGAEPPRDPSDSVPIRIWLAPNEKTPPGRRAGPKSMDTSGYKPCTAYFSDLPRKMQAEIRRAAADRSSVEYSNPLGRWFIRFAAPLPRSSRSVPKTGEPDEQGRMAAALDAFERDVHSKNREKKLSLYQSVSAHGDVSVMPALTENWMKTQVEINRDLIEQKP